MVPVIEGGAFEGYAQHDAQIIKLFLVVLVYQCIVRASIICALLWVDTKLIGALVIKDLAFKKLEREEKRRKKGEKKKT